MSEPGQEGSLQVSNKKVINNLSTKSVGSLWDNLWVICGATVDCLGTYRMVESVSALMHAQHCVEALFY
jgi:hypothetical protein